MSQGCLGTGDAGHQGQGAAAQVQERHRSLQAQEHHGLCPEGELEGVRLVIGAYVKDSPLEETGRARYVQYVEHLSLHIRWEKSRHAR